MQETIEKKSNNTPNWEQMVQDYLSFGDGLWEEEDRKYRTTRSALMASLSLVQKQELHAMEEANLQEKEYAIPYAGQAGLYAGFAYYWTGMNAPSYEELVTRELFIKPNMEKHTVYYAANQFALSMGEHLAAQLEQDAQEQLLQVEVNWEEKIYRESLCAFFLGFHQATTVLTTIQPSCQTCMEKQLDLLNIRLNLPNPHLSLIM